MDNEYFMSLALQQAKCAQEIGEVPVGCVLVQNDTGDIIASGHNRQIIDNNPTAHAEIITLQRAGKVLQNYRLIHTTLFVSLEPCAMCFGAMIHARISKVVFGAYDIKTGACGSCMDLTQQPCFNHNIEVVGGVLEAESKVMLQQFFKERRKKK
jgi:tRNA(adenine34) deaminase